MRDGPKRESDMHVRILCSLLGVIVAAASGCGSNTTAVGTTDTSATGDAMPEPMPDGLAYAVAMDLDPAPDVVEVNLEAKVVNVDLGAGVVSMWTYNGVLPGPRIEAKVGDTVRVHFKNSLPEATTIHWHGLRVPNAMDGVVAAQSPVEPGAEFTYEFVVPDAGTFWYHPHMRSDEQVERGLYGAFVVRGPNELTVTAERTVVLDDIALANGQLAPFSEDDAMIGRQGAVLLANGRAEPMMSLAPGALLRLRLVNAANGRYFRLGIRGRPLNIIGSDAGYLPKVETVDDVLLVPGERVDVLVVASGVAGDVLELVNLPYERGHDTGGEAERKVLSVHLEGAPITTPAVPAPLGEVAQLPTAAVFRTLRLQEMEMAMGGGHGGHGGATGTMMTFMFNDKMPPEMERFTAAANSVEDWKLVNTTEMDHPFHIHGFRFQIASSNGVASQRRAWHDTINVPAKAEVVIKVQIDDRKGAWMFHCHILEHAERGMMGVLDVD